MYSLYIIVTTHPDHYSHEQRVLLERLQVPIVAKPYDLDDVLTTVKRAACGMMSDSK